MIDFIVKLGGAAISDKKAFEKEKPEALIQAARVLASCAKNGLKFIILHGAGCVKHFFNIVSVKLLIAY